MWDINNQQQKNMCMEDIGNINEDELDISNTDTLQIKAIREIAERSKQIEDEKTDKICIDYRQSTCAPLHY